VTEPALRLDELKGLSEREDLSTFLQLAPLVHPSDLADVLAALDEATRVRVASMALAEMEAAEHPSEMLLAVGPEYAAELVEELPSDDAAELVAELPPGDREAVLADVRDRADVDRLLTYPGDAGGRLMTTELAAVREDAVVFLAMIGNLIVAGLAGAFIPIVLDRIGVDPAIASSIFVTTFTDVCGFGLLLGLGTVLLL